MNKTYLTIKIGNMAMTWQAEIVDLLEQLRFVPAAVRIVAGFTHPRLDCSLRQPLRYAL